MRSRYFILFVALLSSCATPRIFAPDPEPAPLIVKLDSTGMATGISISGKIKGDVYLQQGQGNSVANNTKADQRDQTAQKADQRDQSDHSEGIKSSHVVAGAVVLVVLVVGLVLLFIRTRPAT
ncbi:hypothetical protein [Hymenobacter sp. BT190]|uniref:hypothetical protein n=1 Tax=Hymenobacter sp. BT190 TaxID=2763505 RepID=UPI00165198FF|nr:hypothetical protein [Hymenobacter sp. BT190]MBC6698087.1 hypothetical protein [Hymenobacter sp. BT190]